MIVVCKMEQCPFYNKGFCSNKTLVVDINGHCSQLWRNGAPSPRGLEPIDDKFKEDIVIMEGEYHDKEREIFKRDSRPNDIDELFNKKEPSNAECGDRKEQSSTRDGKCTECGNGKSLSSNDRVSGESESTNRSV